MAGAWTVVGGGIQIRRRPSVDEINDHCVQRLKVESSVGDLSRRKILPSGAQHFGDSSEQNKRGSSGASPFIAVQRIEEESRSLRDETEALIRRVEALERK